MLIGIRSELPPLYFHLFVRWGNRAVRGPNLQPRCSRRDDLDGQLRDAGLEPIYHKANQRERFVLKLTADALAYDGPLVQLLARLDCFCHNPRHRPAVGKSSG